MKKGVVKREKHFCSSVWILSKSTPKKVLLIYHKKLKKWQQPGGHIEPGENPIEAAIREVREETGININFLANKAQKTGKYSKFLLLPEFIVEQIIPKYKNYPSHYHLDIQYVVRIEERALKHRSREVQSIGWFIKKEALKLPIHEDTSSAIHKLM